MNIGSCSTVPTRYVRFFRVFPRRVQQLLLAFQFFRRQLLLLMLLSASHGRLQECLFFLQCPLFRYFWILQVFKVLLLILIIFVTSSLLFIEIFQLSKVLFLLEYRLQSGRILSRTKPRSGCIALVMFRHPRFGRFVDTDNLENPYFPIFGPMDFFELCRGDRNIGFDVVSVEIVEKTPAHHGRWCALSINESKGPTGRVVGTMIAVDGIGNPGQMGTLGEIVAAASGPNQHVIGQMAGNFVALIEIGREGFAQQGNVFVIPCIAVGDRCAIRNSGNLVTVCGCV